MLALTLALLCKTIISQKLKNKGKLLLETSLQNNFIYYYKWASQVIQC